MSEFDDDIIAAALEDRAGADPLGIETALATVTHRSATTRRRRAAIAGMGTISGVVVLAVVALASVSPDVVRTPTDSVLPSVSVTEPDVLPSSAPSTVAASTTTTPRASTTAPAPTTTNATTAPTTTPLTTSPDAPPSGTVPVGSTPVSSAPGAPPPNSTSPGSTSPGSTSPGSTSPGTSSPGNTAPDTSEPEDPGPQSTPSFSNRVYSSAGGSITVSWNGQALSLGGTNPATGYSATVEDQRSDRIRVRFLGPQEWRIEVRADSDGVVTSSVSS